MGDDLKDRWKTAADHLAAEIDELNRFIADIDDASPHPVTFNPARYQDTPHITLLTWSNPLLNRLLDLVESA